MAKPVYHPIRPRRPSTAETLRSVINNTAVVNESLASNDYCYPDFTAGSYANVLVENYGAVCKERIPKEKR